MDEFSHAREAGATMADVERVASRRGGVPDAPLGATDDRTLCPPGGG